MPHQLYTKLDNFKEEDHEKYFFTSHMGDRLGRTVSILAQKEIAETLVSAMSARVPKLVKEEVNDDYEKDLSSLEKEDFNDGLSDEFKAQLK